MPASMKKNVEQAVKEGNYASVSEFFRDTIRAWENARLIRELKESRAEIARGKGKLLKSFSDLD